MHDLFDFVKARGEIIQIIREVYHVALVAFTLERIGFFNYS